ncbi:MAG: VaFE repeat-containing surface-anchored protein, partial [Culicoidibacterales bacterium]
QTVRVHNPEMSTLALLGDGTKVLPVNTEVTVIDGIAYTDLIVGKEYIAHGILMDKETGQPLVIDGVEVSGTTKFTPTEANGTVDVEFTFNTAGLDGKELVVFEEVYASAFKRGTVHQYVMEHKDINDEGQTVRVHNPEMSTLALLGDGTKVLPMNSDVTLIDTITYTDLIIGQSYVVSGVLMDKATGEALLIDGKPVFGSTTFTPTEANGTIDVAFTFNTTGLDGKDIVVFEELTTDDGTFVTEHKDINDEGQTVSVDTPTPPLPQTGVYGAELMIGGIALASASAALFAKRQKKQQKK